MAVIGSENQDEYKNFEQRNLTFVLGMCHRKKQFVSAFVNLRCVVMSHHAMAQSLLCTQPHHCILMPGHPSLLLCDHHVILTHALNLPFHSLLM